MKTFLAALGLFSLVAASAVAADDPAAWPRRQVTVVVPFGAGGTTDVFGRIVASHLQAKYNQPYFPEKESDEQSVRNAIRIRVEGEPKPVEVSELRTRLKPLTELSTDRIHYYIPRDLKAEATRLRREWER